MQNIALNRIIDQVNNLYSKNWTGIDITQMLDEIDDQIANTKLPFFTNTIHQVTRHLIGDTLLVIKRLQGIDYTLSKEEDWLSIDKLKLMEWSITINELIRYNEDLVSVLQKMNDTDLDQPILKGHSTVYNTLHGHIQHAYYHFGQITQMKKAVENAIRDRLTQFP